MPTLHQFTGTLDGGATGAHLIEIQRTMRAAGWESEVFCQATKPPYEGGGHHFTEYGKSVAAHPDDVVFYHTAIGSIVADWLIAQRLRRLIPYYHNITPPAWFEGWEPNLTYGLGWGRAQLRQLARRTRFGLAVSAFNARELHDAGVRRTAVLPILLTPESIGGEPDARLVDRVLATGGTRWVFVGRIAPNKGHHHLITALAAYRHLYDPEATLTLVGGTSSPNYEAALHRLVADLELTDAVIFTGQISDGERNAYYATADVFVCLSAHEGFLVPLLEAWRHRVPIVAFDAAAVPETLGDAGLLVSSTSCLPVAAAVARVCSDPMVADALRDAGTRRLDLFAPERTRARLMALAEGLAAGDADAVGLPWGR